MINVRPLAGTDSNYDRQKEVEVFDNSKIGVKGLVDCNMVKIPKFFIHPPQNLANPSDSSDAHLQLPVVNLEGLNTDRREEIVEEIRRASDTWGFFQMVNHGIPTDVLDDVIQGVRRFNEQPNEEKMEFYTRDRNRRVKFSTNYDLLTSEAANWRDTLSANFDGALDPEELPAICRDTTINYVKHVNRLGDTLLELLSEGIRLDRQYFGNIKCQETLTMASHYYPPCPEPKLTLGTSKHADASFLTVLLQDHIGGLQVLHQQHWVDVSPIPGALIVNIGDLLKLITNNKLKSVDHRVLASQIGPRISVACFFTGSREEKPYFPIKELLSDENPPAYKEVPVKEFRAHFFDGKVALDYYKL